MNPLRHVLLATDLSARGDRALDRATALARAWNAPLTVVHVLESWATAGSDLPSWRRQQDPRKLAEQRVRGDLRGPEDLTIDVLVERGDPATVLSEVARRLGCSLIVTGVARDETLGRLIVGSTAENLSRKSRVPILVVKSRPHGPYRDVVVATDFSEGSRIALDAVIRMLPDARLTMFHAFDVVYENLIDDKFAAREAERRQAIARCEAFIAATPAAAASGRPIGTLCEYGDPGTLLADLAIARGIDLVVLGTQGAGVLRGVLFGSVTQRMLADVPVDLLVVPPGDDAKTPSAPP